MNLTESNIIGVLLIFVFITIFVLVFKLIQHIDDEK